MPDDIRRLRTLAISQTFFRPTTLRTAMNRLGFVQADPLRFPAHAQDLILRHRVKGYREGDIERRYAALDLEENGLYAYGFLTRQAWQITRPRKTTRPLKFDRDVLSKICQLGPTHPRDLEAHFGRKTVKNDWGGKSQATKTALERLHYGGHLRIAGRKNGIRLYEQARLQNETLTPVALQKQHILLLANLLGPISSKMLHRFAGRRQKSTPRSVNHRTLIKDMVEGGELEQVTVDDITYLWPASKRRRDESSSEVRFLCPFDPLIWDRDRFEHIWGWAYRFEAYTPPAKRVRGYYALPMLWRDQMIGWANANVVEGKLQIKLGYVKSRPRSRDFRQEVEAECERMAAFLTPSDLRWELIM